MSFLGTVEDAMLDGMTERVVNEFLPGANGEFSLTMFYIS